MLVRLESVVTAVFTSVPEAGSVTLDPLPLAVSVILAVARVSVVEFATPVPPLAGDNGRDGT
jgi:hypothetical protein